MGAQAVRLSNVDIDNALKNKDFEVLFQPIFDLGNGALARMETFVRWRHPSLGVLPPGAFISFFESQGRMSELSRYVLSEALRNYCEWRGPYAPGFSINLALSDLSDEAFAAHFSKIARDYDFPTDLVTFECPMPPVNADLKAASRYFARLSDTGARLAIEVRGRANDFLNDIDPFPFDEIKTGGSAILRFARTVRGPGLSAISDLLDIANKANAAITAVGVEDQASLAALRGLGFTAAQGNHLGKVGDLKDFRSARVNEVRKLLDLEPLSAESLAALFRTTAPAPKAADPEEAAASDDAAPPRDDALLNRLNERVAQHNDSEKETIPQQKTPPAVKARALAKKAKEREARKVAAIAQAKNKAAMSDTEERPPSAPDSAKNQAPRDLQKRLTKEFANAPETAPKSDPMVPQNAPAPASSAPVSASASAATPSTNESVGPKKEKRPTVSTKAPKKTGDVKKSPTSDAVNADAVKSPQASPPEPASPKTPLLVEKIALGSTAVAAALIAEIRVGGPGPRMQAPPAPTLQSPPAQQDPWVADTPAQTPTMGKENEPAASEPAGDEPEVKDHSEVAAPSDAASIPELVGSQAYEEAKEAQTKRPKKPRKPKPFLMRRYQLWPTHFWPKSWRRAWRQKALERTAEQNDPSNSETKAT